MKLLELRFKNLNSLYGEWIIDFTDPDYVANGLFALTGPTGAGKSTILDAICLALYGATPRLGKITKSGNEIMSRQTGECYAEVLFASQAGRFRCHWEQRRARKKPAGNLQDQEHQIADADTGQLIETKKSLVGGVIEAKTGMDFDRFTRSILLAQGGFDTFLKADSEQKSRILEQITGTEIYSDISRRVHERQRDEREQLMRLQAETAGIVMLAPEQEQAIQHELVARQQQETALAAQAAAAGTAITWLTTIEDLKKEILSLTEEAAKLKVDTEAFKSQRVTLEQAIQAASLDGLYATLISLRKQQADDQASLTAGEAALPELESAANTRTEAVKVAEQLTLKAKEELKTATPLIQNIRLLDQTIAEQKKAISAGAAACARGAAKIETDQQAKEKEEQKRATAEKERAAAVLYLEENARDEWLIGGLAGVEEQFGHLLAKQREIAHNETSFQAADAAVADAAKQLQQAAKQCSVKRQRLASASNALRQSKHDLNQLLDGKLLREYRTEKETRLREMAFISKIEALEDHRAMLEDGKACPLCGSTEHPFVDGADGKVPVTNEIERKIAALTALINEAEDREVTINKLEQAAITARNHLNDSEKLEIEAANQKKVAEDRLAESKDALTKGRLRFDDFRLAVSAKLEPLGITAIPETEVEAMLGSLRSRLEAWQAQVRQKTDIEKQLAAIEGEVRRLDAVIATQREALAEKEANLKHLKKERDNEIRQRKQRYGDKNPDEEESRLHKGIVAAEEAEKTARSLNAEWQQQLTAAKTHRESLQQRIEQRAPALKKAAADFSAALASVGFADEQAFLAARLSAEDRASLSARARELDNTATALTAKQQDREARLAKEIDKNLTDKRLEALEPQFAQYEQSLQAVRDAIASLKHQLGENRVARERIKDKQSAIEARQKECRRWDKLHGLIGSADGKKYRNFAQGLTFELMVSHANRQLDKMTDRYLLIRDRQQPLELNVVDNYQAGEIRSTRNLSGGESFIVSLALALGLSKMASRRVRVDSLFLDEGFGTLDEDALETALETLSGLQQDGKLIGVISHVSALQERISVQIKITPVSGGRSTLSGPGCTIGPIPSLVK